MNEEFKDLLKESSLTKYRFCKIIGMTMSNANKYFNDQTFMKKKTFLKYSCKLKY